MKNLIKFNHISCYLIAVILITVFSACNISESKNNVNLAKEEQSKTVDKPVVKSEVERESGEPKVNNKAMMALIEKSKKQKGNILINEEVASDGRPKSVPASAIWVGEKGKGAYVKLSASSSDPNRFFGFIYLESGKLHYKGPLEVKPGKDQRFEFDNPASYASFDGDNLVLKDGRIVSGIRIY